MSYQKNLYFIAIIPSHNVRERIKGLKESMKERFKAQHALKSPSHITLQMPFKRSEAVEKHLNNALKIFADQQKPFQIELSGFGCFAPRVIFVKVKDHNLVVRLHNELKKVLSETLGFKANEMTSKFHPHMTIATRDLNASAFYNAWIEYEHSAFNALFLADSIALLKHNGKYWDIYRKFPFQK